MREISGLIPRTQPQDNRGWFVVEVFPGQCISATLTLSSVRLSAKFTMGVINMINIILTIPKH